MNSNMITNKYVYKIQQFMLYLTALSSEFIDTVLMTFVDIVFVMFVGLVFVKCVDVLSIVFEILLRTQLLKYQQYFLDTYHSPRYMC